MFWEVTVAWLYIKSLDIYISPANINISEPTCDSVCGEQPVLCMYF